MGEERDKSSKRGGGGNRGPRGEGYGKGYKGDNENKNVDPGKMKINCTNTTQ